MPALALRGPSCGEASHANNTTGARGWRETEAPHRFNVGLRRSYAPLKPNPDAQTRIHRGRQVVEILRSLPTGSHAQLGATDRHPSHHAVVIGPARVEIPPILRVPIVVLAIPIAVRNVRDDGFVPPKFPRHEPARAVHAQGPGDISAEVERAVNRVLCA